ncbi:MAG TPA: shikimate dehydrogenase [Pyrinomonadaceae bacterium]|nr:shikimate dehydrogenase [Pyrinomonadaceae bacterium]
MNSGKLCISLSARKASELFEKIERADQLADVIEIRFDLLDSGEVAKVLAGFEEISVNADLLATNRPAADSDSKAFEERIRFWESILTTKRFRYIDLEEDLVFALSYNRVFSPELLAGHEIIGSHHNFYETPPDIGPVLKAFEPDPDSSFKCDAVKIATTANSITDTIELWYVLDWAKHYGMQAVPIAMGEAGKWTRILGLAHGAFLTYAALDQGGRTAPGQITADDLLHVYRVKELDRGTQVYGVIAGDTSYSMSPYIQNAAFGKAAMNRVFVPLQVDYLGEFISKMVRPASREIDLNFHGFAVTNPHKQAIIDHLDEIDETARAIGAVNTVFIKDGKLAGTNTDAVGFLEPLVERFGSLVNSRVLIHGAGGAARACVHALQTAGAEVIVTARYDTKAKALAEEFEIAFVDSRDRNLASTKPDILVNATPAGTRGDLENVSIATADELNGVKLVYDLTYNPRETRLIREACAAGCETLDGLKMLIAQGALQFKLWTGEAPDREAMQATAIDRLSK